MKTETISYRKLSTSSTGAAWSVDTAAPDSVASQIKNCVIVTEPSTVGRHELCIVGDGPKPAYKMTLRPAVTKP